MSGENNPGRPDRARLILIAGKGGVGKSTVASATGIACAQKGLKALVLSIDIAHSLGDSFAIDRDLMDHNQGKPITVRENLDIQEIDLQVEIETHWSELYSSLKLMLKNSGMHDILAEELAIVPGMADIVCLLYISHYMEMGKYDVIILDNAPTGESLRFISMPSTIDWYLQKLYKIKSNVASIAQPLKKILGRKSAENGMMTPYGDLDKLKRLYDRLGTIRDLLIDNSITTVRLVCNAEKMVINETVRAFTYFCLYGMTVDMVVVNKLLPDEACDGYFAGWVEDQKRHTAYIENQFAPLIVRKVEIHKSEVNGLERLTRYADSLYSGIDPAAVLNSENPYMIDENDEYYSLTIKLSGAGKESVDLFKQNEELVIRIGNFKRNLYLPRKLAGIKPEFARFENGRLEVRFRKKSPAPEPAGGKP